jgi:hypothetical protein
MFVKYFKISVIIYVHCSYCYMFRSGNTYYLGRPLHCTLYLLCPYEYLFLLLIFLVGCLHPPFVRLFQCSFLMSFTFIVYVLVLFILVLEGVWEHSAEENTRTTLEEGLESWRKYCKHCLHDSYSSPDVIKVVKARIISCKRHAGYIGVIGL